MVLLSGSDCPFVLGVIRSCGVGLHSQYGEDSVRKPGSDLPSVTGAHIRQGASHVYPMIQERVGDTGGRGIPVWYRADRSR